jgi:hypothetical protein
VLKGKSGIDFLKARDGTRDLKIKCGPGSNRAERAERDRRLDPGPTPAERRAQPLRLTVASSPGAMIPACTGSITDSGSSLP